MKDYIRILTRISGAPLFISESKLNVISENIIIPLVSGISPNNDYTTPVELTTVRAKNVSAATKSTQANDSYAVIKVFDSLVSKNGGGLSGFTSYESIRQSIELAITNGNNNILLYIDSPGGEATGLFALTDYIRTQVETGVNIIGFTDGMATSAAYAIMAATRISYATETSLLGSIAALMVHVETSKADATNGKTYTIFRSKEEKALADSHTPLTDKAKEKITTMLDSFDASFNNDVILSRPSLELANIIAMKGSEFMAGEALQLGLIDRIVTNIDIALTMGLQDKNKLNSINLASTLNSTGVHMNEIDQLKAALATAQAEKITLEAELKAAMQLAVEKERTNMLAICNAAITLNTPMSTVVAHLTKGYSSEVSLEIQTAIAETKSTDTVINAAALHSSENVPTTTNEPSGKTALLSAAKSVGLIK